jgi:hypothetical protein
MEPRLHVADSPLLVAMIAQHSLYKCEDIFWQFCDNNNFG